MLGGSFKLRKKKTAIKLSQTQTEVTLKREKETEVTFKEFEKSVVV